MSGRSSAGRALGRLFPTRSSSVRALLEIAEKVTGEDAGLFISGESGSGKDYLAESIHSCSPRRKGTFVRIDCAAIPAELFESEIFGYEKGAFTDARSRKLGKLDGAQGGTVYFDEIASLALPLQAKLLRVIQEKKFSRLGGPHLLDLDARIMASSSRSPESLVSLGELRSDLYYRLNVISLVVPPLRERMEDIPLLARTFTTAAAVQHKKNVETIEPAAMELLTSYGWPGNVRELRNVIERAVLLAEGPLLTAELLPRERFLTPHDFVEKASSNVWTLEQLERSYIREILRRTGSHYSEAAAILGINRKTLREKRKKFDLE